MGGGWRQPSWPRCPMRFSWPRWPTHGARRAAAEGALAPSVKSPGRAEGGASAAVRAGPRARSRWCIPADARAPPLFVEGRALVVLAAREPALGVGDDGAGHVGPRGALDSLQAGGAVDLQDLRPFAGL